MRSKKGIVVSDKQDKTVTVAVHSYVSDKKYKKKRRVTKKYHVHDEDNKFKEGDEVEFYETNPISKNKCWTTVKPKKS